MPNPRASTARPSSDESANAAGRRPTEHHAAPAVDFWAVFDCAPDAYLLLATDAPRFTMVAANEARLHATMTKRPDVLGRPLFEVFPDNPSDSTASGVHNLQASLDEVLRTGKPHRMPLQKYDIRRPDGSFEERYWDTLNSPVFDKQGKVIFIIHRVEDVTEQVRTGRRLEALQSAAEKTSEQLSAETRARREIEELVSRLRESEQRYRLLADMIPQSIWTTDANGYHGYFSRRWYDFAGATLEDAKGTGWMKYLHPDDVARTTASWEHSLRTGERYSIEYRLRKHTGEYCWFWGQAAPLRDDTGRIVQWFGTFIDISDRKHHEQEREHLLEREREARAEAERRQEALERVTESRTRLMRGFSHDLKNPLGAADGYAALLQEGIGGELAEPHLKSVERIRRSIQTALRLINDLLELARAEAGQVELKMERFDAAELARETAEDFRAQIDAAGLSLDVRAADSLPVESDPTRVRQILSNLVSNAAKYTRAGRITIDAGQCRGRPEAPGPGDWVTITVVDTGPGISPEQCERIFQEFTRLDPNAPHGAGVGLAISRRIACLLSGDVTVDSEVGRGSTFTLWLRPAA